MLVYGAHTHKRDRNEGLGVCMLLSNDPSICSRSRAGETLWVMWIQQLNSSSSVLESQWAQNATIHSSHLLPIPTCILTGHFSTRMMHVAMHWLCFWLCKSCNCHCPLTLKLCRYSLLWDLICSQRTPEQTQPRVLQFRKMYKKQWAVLLKCKCLWEIHVPLLFSLRVSSSKSTSTKGNFANN